jgi:hypothetical protein
MVTIAHHRDLVEAARLGKKARHRLIRCFFGPDLGRAAGLIDSGAPGHLPLTCQHLTVKASWRASDRNAADAIGREVSQCGLLAANMGIIRDEPSSCRGIGERFVSKPKKPARALWLALALVPCKEFLTFLAEGLVMQLTR